VKHRNINRALTHYAHRCRSEIVLEDLFSSALSHFKKYHASGNLQFNNLGIFQSLKLRVFVEKILPISLKLNFTPNTLACYGLRLCSPSRSLLLCESPFLRHTPYVNPTSFIRTSFLLLTELSRDFQVKYLTKDLWI